MLDDADEFITPSFVGLIESIHVCHNHLKSLKYRNNWAQSYEIFSFFSYLYTHEYNKTFLAQKGYEKYLTDKYPDKKLAVLSCMDTRLTELLPAALGLKNGDAKIIKNAGGLVISAFDSAMRSLIVAIYELGVQEIMVVAHSHCGACHMSYDHFHHEMIARGVTDETLDTIRKCGIDLDQWLEGFKDTPTSVRKTVETIKNHPLVPKDIVVRGFIIDSETGALEEIV